MAGLAALVTRPGLLLLSTVSRDVSLLAAVVALLRGRVVSSSESSSSSTAGWAVSGNVSDTTAVVASPRVVSAETHLSLTVLGLGALSSNVSGLTASVALSSGGTSRVSSGVSGGTSLRALAGDVAFLSARVARLGLGGWAVLAQVSGLATRVAGWDTRVGASRSKMARSTTVEAVSASSTDTAEHFFFGSVLSIRVVV